MKWLKPWMFATLAGAGAGCGAVEPEAEVVAEGPQRRGQRATEDQMMPSGLTQEEKSRTESDPAQGASQAYVWECNPELYGFTAASRKVTLPSEAESTTGLLIGWPS